MCSLVASAHETLVQSANLPRSKLTVGFQNVLRKNPLPVVSLVSPRETCVVIEGDVRNQPVTSGA